ncbi:MAG: ABC transporter substrate-binding protein, partial [Clostridiales bacterium]|nr:ABC transporter substrate-binding protein [Clostridiales bacterium]
MKKFLALTLTLVMVLSLAACGGKKETPAAPAEENKESAAAQTEIVWWAFPTFGVDSGYEQELADAFMAANPDVKITVETIDFQSGPDALTSAITAGTAPDILFDAPGRIIEYGNAGNLVALDDMIADLKSDLSSESLLETCVGADGSYYMYPISSSPFYMGLNKEMLEKADALQYVNLEGDRTWTTENFVKMCEALRDAGVCMTPGIVYCGAQGGDQGTRA